MAAAFGLGVLAGFEAGASAMFLLTRPRVRRWWRWTLLCRRGKRCANLNVSEVGGDIPVGTVGVIEYECVKCRTSYRTSVVLGNDGSYTQSDRERV